MPLRVRSLFPSHPQAPTHRYTLRSTLKGLTALQRDRLLALPDHSLVAPGQAEELEQLLGELAIAKRSAALESAQEATRFRADPVDEAVVDELKPYLVGDFPPLLSDPFPSFDKRRGPPVSQHQAKELAKVHKRLAKKHEIGRKRLDAVESVPVCVGTEVLRASSTGWSGLSSGYGKKVQHAELQARNVSLIRYEGKPTALVTSDGHQVVVRTSRMSDEMLDRLDSFTSWMNQEPQLSQLSSNPNERGTHRLGLYGTTRAYSKINHLTAMHSQYPEAVQRLLEHPDQVALSAWVSAALRNHFTDVHTRFFNADPGRSDPNDPLRCRFGVFPLLCVNFPSDGPVNCVPHTDYKNPAGGICAVVPYGTFDSTKRHWLYFHDLGVAMEMPAGCCALYPSSLLQHSNVCLVEADSKEQVLAGKGLARGSIVWFAQAAYVMLNELGMTASEAKKAGLRADFPGFIGLFPSETL